MLKQKYYGLNAGAGIFLVTFLLSVLGVFNLPNLFLYDVFTSYTPAVDKERPKVLLIQVDEKYRAAGDDVWISLIQSLDSLGAQQINFMFFPENATANFYQEAVQIDKLLFARKLVNISKKTFIPKLVPVPDIAVEAKVEKAISYISQPVYGVSRKQVTELRFQDEIIYPFEMQAARRYNGNFPEIADESFLVDFVGGAGTLPLIRLEKVLDGDLVPELVNGRSIVIGMVGLDDAIIVPPLLNHDELISPLVFHGHALETLLSDRVMTEVQWYISAVLLLLIVLLSLMAYQRLGVRLSIWLALILFGILFAFSWFLLIHLQIWQPIVELGFVQFAALVVFVQRKMKRDNVVLQELLFETSAKIRERVFLPSFYESTEPWSQVVSMINLSLDLNRVILLERVPSEHRLREVKALNCVLEDIHEMRRDYERTPYSTAIHKNGPIVVSEFLSSAGSDETQYLVPLVHAGNVLGFWAFGIAPDKVQKRPNFEAIVQDFAHQIAELLHYRQQWLNRQTSSQSYIQSFLQLDADTPVHQELNKFISLVEIRLNILEDFLNGLSTSAILYDLFGRVILVNETMVKLLENHRILPYEMTAVDLIARLSGIELDKVRIVIEHVVIERSQSTLLVKELKEDEGKYLLHISPLLKKADVQMTTDLDTPLNLSGILCELIDITTVKHINSVKENLATFVCHQLHNDMSAIKDLSENLDEEDLDRGEQIQFLQLIRERIEGSINMLQKSDVYLNKDLWNGGIESYPVDASAAIVSAVAAMEEKAALHGNTFQCEFPDQHSLVLADADETKKLFMTVFLILLQDAAENTAITIHIEDQDGFMIYNISNTGFGMPNERFQKYLFGSEHSSSEEFRRLRYILPHVMIWGGQLEGYSEVGTGTSITVKLKRFI